MSETTDAYGDDLDNAVVHLRIKSMVDSLILAQLLARLPDSELKQLNEMMTRLLDDYEAFKASPIAVERVDHICRMASQFQQLRGREGW